MTLQNQSVLVTGGTGSFGHAFVQRCLDEGARRVVVFSRDELKQAQMAQQFPDPRLRWFLGDVRSPDRLLRAFHGVDVVVHAAAMKRIDACEANPDEAIRTNVLGSLNVAKAAIDAGVRRAVFLSTDKAPNAATLYGATKFCAERSWCAANVYAAGTSTRLSATRYGNVLGSRGSVLDLFRRQRQAGEPLTITDERATRFWMTLESAVELVLLALDQMRGGEVFVPKCGSASVLDLARAVVEPPAYAPGHVVTGLRPSERLHETLIGPDEARDTYDRGTYYIIEPTERTWDDRAPFIVYANGYSGVPAGFSYRSDTNPQQLTVADLRRMVA